MILQALIVMGLGYAAIGFVTATLTAHRLTRGWTWILAFLLIIIAWPAIIFDYCTDKMDF